jgi:hypothetical protein
MDNVKKYNTCRNYVFYVDLRYNSQFLTLRVFQLLIEKLATFSVILNRQVQV